MSFRKGLVLSFGLINAIVAIDGAKTAEESLNQVCVGVTGKAPHPPSPLKQQMTCSHCGVVPYAEIKKAQKQGSDQYVVVDQAEVATVRDSVVGTSKKLLAITVHDADEVGASTLPGKSTYFIEPDGVAQTAAYSLMVDAVARHPEMAFLTEFTPTSKAAMYQLRVFNDVLVMQSLCWPEDVKAVPNTGSVIPDDGLKAKLDTILADTMQPFVPADYRNDYALALGALIASKEAVTGEVVESTRATKSVASTAVVDLSSQLDAMLASLAPAPAKKTRTRKVS